MNYKSVLPDPLYVVVLCLSFCISLYLTANIVVVDAATNRIFTTASDLPDRRVALLLGTSSLTRGGNPSPFFRSRMQAAAYLYHSGKVDFILASGDNQYISYNEPYRMMESLTALGVPEDRIVLDYAGFSTLDSIVRARKVFGQRRVTVVSQEFQNERAVFLGVYTGLDVVAYNAGEVSGYMGFAAEFRESFARLKAFLDVFILNTGPRFLGDPVAIE